MKRVEQSPFQLTASEQRVAQQLQQTPDVKQAAQQLGLNAETVRRMSYVIKEKQELKGE